MAILDDIKKELRISNTAYDTEITGLIDFAKDKMLKVGIIKGDETDSLIHRAISLYVKSQFGWDNPDSEKLMSLYNMLEIDLKQSKNYGFYTVTFTLPEQGKITFNGKTLESNNSGVVIFYVRPENHIEYNYYGTIGYVDVTEDTAVSL